MSSENAAINRNMALFLNGMARGNALQARHALSRLNASGGANNRRYPRGSGWFTINPYYLEWLNAIKSGQPVNPSLTGYILNTIPGQLHTNQPTVGWNRYVPGQTPIMRNAPPGASANNINSIYRRFLNAIRNGNGSAQARAWRELNSTSGANNRRYPTLLRFLTNNSKPNIRKWVGLSRSGNVSRVDGPATANAIRYQLSINQPNVWGGAQNTIASFNRAQRNRNTFNRYANLWFGLNTRGMRLSPSILRNLVNSPSSGSNGASKLAKMTALFNELTGSAPRQSQPTSRARYTIANFNNSPRSRNTLSNYAREWLGVNISRTGNLHRRISLSLHPNRAGPNASQNILNKRHRLMLLFNELTGR